MGLTFALVVGFGIAAFGLLLMRDPIRLSWLDPGAKAYYQRSALRGRIDRLQLRMLGMIVSFFGWVIATGVLSGTLKVKILDTISDGFLLLLWLSFIGAFVFGMIYMVHQMMRGQGKELLFGWFKMRKRFITLGPVDFDPATTLQMKKEARIFAIVYCVLIGLCLVVPLVYRP
jgi:hypothetical protein